MPQLDEIALILGIVTLLTSLYIFYYLNLTKYLPIYTETKKAKVKISRVLTKLLTTENYSIFFQLLDKNSFQKIKRT